MNYPNRWPMFRRVWQRAQLLDTMLERLGRAPVDAAKLDAGNAIREARDQCLRCHDCNECESILEAAEALPLPPDFCPNRDFLARLEATEQSHNDEQEPSG